MKKNNRIAGIIALILFSIPFFWLPPGFVDLGGDSGRLYFVDPLASAFNLYKNQNALGASVYAFIPYELFLFLLKSMVGSPSALISLERGLQLSLAFLSIYAVVIQLVRNRWVGILSGLVYLGFITKVGWFTSLEVHNQVFLNPLIFFLMMRYVLSGNFLYMISLLFISFLYSGNFGYSAMPQLLSFFPLAIICLFFLCRFVFHTTIPWRGFIGALALFFGLHAFHLIPMISTILDTTSSMHAGIFSDGSIQSSGVYYFVANHASLGKISSQLFSPALWNSQTLFSLVIPLFIVIGFFYGRIRHLAILGMFFSLTLFLSSANITHIGVKLYELLFYIPGFYMFRSFQEKWHFVYAFFAALTFGVAFYAFAKHQRKWIWVTAGLLVVVSLAYRTLPFLRGEAILTSLYQSNNVSGVFSIDPDLLDTISFIKTLSQDGRFLTLPLTFPYYQIAYGKEGGAYVGISLIPALTGRQDFPGFWRFGHFGFDKQVFDALSKQEDEKFVQILSMLNTRYIFRNSDPRIMDNFPGYPYVYPGMIYSSKDQLPAIENQQAYDRLLAKLPVEKIYEKGFYTVYELDKHVVRPIFYIPDVLTRGPEEAMRGAYRSAFSDSDIEVKSGETEVSYTVLSPAAVNVQIALTTVQPFSLVFLQPFDSRWNMQLEGASVRQHFLANGYANGWIIDPTQTEIRGVAELATQKYFVAGRIISGITVMILIGLLIRILVWRRR